jgi:hypothetical protein
VLRHVTPVHAVFVVVLCVFSYAMQRHVMPVRVAPERVHKSHFIYYYTFNVLLQPRLPVRKAGGSLTSRQRQACSQTMYLTLYHYTIKILQPRLPVRKASGALRVDGDRHVRKRLFPEPAHKFHFILLYHLTLQSRLSVRKAGGALRVDSDRHVRKRFRRGLRRAPARDEFQSIHRRVVGIAMLL